MALGFVVSENGPRKYSENYFRISQLHFTVTFHSYILNNKLINMNFTVQHF